MHCNLRPPEPRQPLSRSNYDAMPSLTSLNLSIAAYTLLYAVTSTFYSVTLTFDLWLWTSVLYCLWRNKTMYQIWTQSNYPRRSYCDFSVWPYDLEHCVTCCARLWDYFHQVWPSTTFPSLHYSVFMLIRYATLWSKALRPLDRELLQLLGCHYHAFKLCTKFERSRLIHGWVFDDLARFRLQF